MEQKIPKVTIIIPVYNAKLYLDKCLQSVVAQSLKEIEIICVNDGSTDESVEILECYAAKDTRIQIISQKNKGVSASKNKGMQYAKGEYLYFMNSDDYIEEDAMEFLYKQAKIQKLDVVYFNGRPIFNSERPKQKSYGYIKYYQRKHDYIGVKQGIEMADEMFMHEEFIPSCPLQFFLHSFVIDNHIKFREDIIYEDNLFSLEVMLRAKRVMYINKIYYNGRIRENSIYASAVSVKKYKEYYEGMLGIQALFRRFNNDLTEELKKKLLALADFFKRRADKVYAVLESDEKQKAKDYILEKQKELEISFSVIAPTNKSGTITDIVENYKRQKWEKKELIIILNKDDILIDDVKDQLKEEEGITVYQVDEVNTLGDCLNFGIEKAKYNYIAKFDDDDYYGSKYLTEAARLFQTKICEIVGKNAYRVYVQEYKILCGWKTGKQHEYVDWIAGGTIICKKKVAEEIKFDNLNLGEDADFIHRSMEAGYRVYSGSMNNYLYMRYYDTAKHTWKVTPDFYLEHKDCEVWENVEYTEAIARINKIDG